MGGLLRFAAYLVQIGLERLAADGRHAHRELGVAGGQHVRVQLVGEEVAQQAGAIGVVLAPAEVVVGVEAVAGLDLLAEPHLPVDVVGLGPRGNGVVPLAVRVVAHVAALAHDDGADLAGTDPFGGLVPLAIGAALRTDLQQFAGALAGVVDLECFAEVAGHGLLDIDMLAGVHGFAADLGVPVVDRGAEDDVDVLALEDTAEVFVAVGLDVGLLLDFGDVVVDTVLGDVADGSQGNVVLLIVFEVEANVGSAALTADADKSKDDLVVGADDSAGVGGGELGEGFSRGGRLVGQDACDATGCCRALQEFAAGGAGIRWGGGLRSGHNSSVLSVTGDVTILTHSAFEDKPGGKASALRGFRAYPAPLR